MKLKARGTWCIEGAPYIEVISYGYDSDGDLNNTVCIGWSGDQETPFPMLLGDTDIRRVFARYECVLPSQDSESAADRA